MNYLGVSVGFVLGPLCVDQAASAPEIRAQLQKLYRVLAVISVAIFLAILAYFPSAAPTPPTPSSEVTKTDFTVGFKQLLVHKRNWLLCLCCGLVIGFYGGWVILSGCGAAAARVLLPLKLTLRKPSAPCSTSTCPSTISRRTRSGGWVRSRPRRGAASASSSALSGTQRSCCLMLVAMSGCSDHAVDENHAVDTDRTRKQ